MSTILIAEQPSSTPFTASAYSEAIYSFSMPCITGTVSLLTFVPPSIRVPPPLSIPEIPLRERRGFVEFISIVPRSVIHDGSGKSVEEAVPIPAKGHLEPKAGALPRRRRRVPSARRINNQNVVPAESKDFEF